VGDFWRVDESYIKVRGNGLSNPLSRALIRKVEDILFPLFWRAQCLYIPIESRSFYEVAVFLRLYARSRFIGGLARDRSSTRVGGDRGGARFSGGGARFAGTHFTARSDDRFHRQFHNGNGGVVIFDPLDYGSYYDLPTDDTVYQGR
jgi:hypothetical protein